MEQLEFIVAQDIFINESCAFADVFLPAVPFAEKDGTFTNTDRRVQQRATGDCTARTSTARSGHYLRFGNAHRSPLGAANHGPMGLRRPRRNLP